MTIRIVLALVCLGVCGEPRAVDPGDLPTGRSSTASDPPAREKSAEGGSIAPGFEGEWVPGEGELYGLLPTAQPVVARTLARDGEGWSQCSTARPALEAATGAAAWEGARSELRAAAESAGLLCNEVRCAAGDPVVELDELRVCRRVTNPRAAIHLAFGAWGDAGRNVLGVFRTLFQDQHVAFMSEQHTRRESGSSERRYVVRYEDLHRRATELVQQWALSVDAIRLPGPGPWGDEGSVGYGLESEGWRTIMWGQGTSISIEVTDAPPEG